LLKEFILNSLNTVFDYQRVEIIKKIKKNPKQKNPVIQNIIDQSDSDSELW